MNSEAGMRSCWVDHDAAVLVERYAPEGVGTDMALRIYTARLLGQDPALVLHGGGNVSVKIRMRDLLGDEVDVLCVKGSGWDMASIEPAGLPALRLEPLQRLRRRERLSDPDMIRVQRSLLLDPLAPNPSVETLLHAFLPGKYVEHTHSTAVLSLADQRDAATICSEVFDGRVGLVPYRMPGFDLAKTAADVFDADPQVEGLILLKHGIFTFGASAREAYERMIELVSVAEAHVARNLKAVFETAQLPQRIASPAEVAPVLRGACSMAREGAGDYRRPVLEFRSGPAVLNFVNGTEIGRYSQAGVVTPDHTIRLKGWPLVVAAPKHGNIAAFASQALARAADFVERYHAYFTRNNARCGNEKKMLDPMPRVVLVPGLGLFALGRSKSDARIIADLAESALGVITEAEALGRFESISEAQMFDIEYWSLEQAKLGKEPDEPLAGQVAVITGGAGAIGAATGRALAAAGAEIALLDIDAAKATALARQIAATALGVECDVSDRASVRAAFDRVVEAFGGVDIVVSNAGAAWEGRIGEVDDATLRRSFELNFFAHQTVAQTAVGIMLAQGTGGALLFNVSKQAVNPGPGFGPYGLPKAATLFLVRQYALEYGRYGIRANAVNADRVRSGLLNEERIASRTRARGEREQDYLTGNLLGREIKPEDVAQAFLHHAVALKTTADVTTVDGGNIAAALR
jgi:rhamnose utilization protein RhaD (predicted bifunctional aldolase and dehydrogenase)/NAD(P)-dependent dehydrogenase (short-subunit alcohol dehydrogenase family)